LLTYLKNQFATWALLFMGITTIFFLLILREFGTSGLCWHL
jgi:hypothetical protein